MKFLFNALAIVWYSLTGLFLIGGNILLMLKLIYPQMQLTIEDIENPSYTDVIWMQIKLNVLGVLWIFIIWRIANRKP
ncbi:MAG: hypothetical protein COA78_02675 [Blastopirellula sp.]|nr:MAG: hypothetical protein COA78_02675 [Blastopirellula sp.]